MSYTLEEVTKVVANKFDANDMQFNTFLCRSLLVRQYGPSHGDVAVLLPDFAISW